MVKKIFWIHFDKEKFQDGIKAKHLSKILSNFSGLYLNIAIINEYDKNPQFKRKDFMPNFFPIIRDGSHAIGIQLKPPIYYVPLPGDPFKKLEEEVKEIIQIETSEDPRYQKFLKKYNKPEDRVSILKCFKNLQPFYENDFKLTYNELKEDWKESEFEVYFTKEKRNIIQDLINVEKIEGIPNITGIFDGFKKKWETFWIITLEGKEIICKYEDELKKYNLKDDQIYRVFGEYKETPGGKPVISDILDIYWLGPTDLFDKLKIKYNDRIKRLMNRTIIRNENLEYEYKRETINNSLFFISKLIHYIKNEKNYDFPFPMIFPGAFGNIELEWTEDKFDLQITIPENLNLPLNIYFSNKKDDDFYKEYLFNTDMEKITQWLQKILL